MTTPATAPALGWVREALSARCGLRSEEVTDASLERSLRLAAVSAQTTFDELVARIRAPETDGGLALQHLLRKVTVGETSFFRHPEDLDWLRTRVLPALVARRATAGSKRLRIWSAGCATGEEPYTLAMLALEAVPDPSWDVQVLGTDINDEALEGAHHAEYGEWSFRGVPAELRERWFTKVEARGKEGRWQPIRSARERVEFQYLNLRDPIYPAIFTRTTELDLVVCRNVFLYFFPEMVRTCLERFAAAVVDDGFVLCGPADLFHVHASDIAGIANDGSPNRIRVDRGAIPSPEPGIQVPVRRPSPTRPGTTPVRRPVAPPPPPLLPRTASPSPASPTAPPSGPSTELVRLLKAGDYAAAAARAAAMVEDDPLSIDACRCLALALSATRPAEAVETWRRVLYLAPADPGAHFAIGMLLRAAGRHPEARAHFRSVVKLLRDFSDSDHLPGPDALPIAWVRSACRSLSDEATHGRTR